MDDPKKTRRKAIPSRVHLKPGVAVKENARNFPEQKGKEFERRERVSKEIYNPVLGQGRDLDAERAPIGAPKTKSRVDSTFDARPINAYDWYATGPGVTVTDYDSGAS